MFELNQLDDVVVIGVGGELSLKNVRTLDSILNNILQTNFRKVILDFSSLAHIDYKLVTHLTDRVLEWQCLGGDLKLAGTNDYIGDILRAMGFEWEVYGSVTDAAFAFSPEDLLQWQ